jgi:hypothetical protein
MLALMKRISRHDGLKKLRAGCDVEGSAVADSDKADRIE